MSSRFVPAGTEVAKEEKSDGWAKARNEVEAQRLGKSKQESKQEDGKSLYEVLQANKGEMT